jgi:DNA-binding CsgD family transcriptional regulator
MVGYRLQPTEKALREPYLTAVRSRLDEASWEDAQSEGRAMSFEAAIAYALSEDEYTSSISPTEGPPHEMLPVVRLTRREREIAVLVARGKTNRQIAANLSISEHTAATHVMRILKKLGLRSLRR